MLLEWHCNIYNYQLYTCQACLVVGLNNFQMKYSQIMLNSFCYCFVWKLESYTQKIAAFFFSLKSQKLVEGRREERFYSHPGLYIISSPPLNLSFFLVVWFWQTQGNIYVLFLPPPLPCVQITLQNCVFLLLLISFEYYRQNNNSKTCFCTFTSYFKYLFT